jgi:two-component system, LytTR family, sensor kinase
MEALTYTLEKACVLVTLMFVLGRTGFVARLAGLGRRAGGGPSARSPSLAPVPPARQDSLLGFGFFSLMALTEFWVAAQHRTLLNARFIATCTAGLLAGPWMGTAVGVTAGLLALLLANASPVGYVLPLVAWGLMAGLVRQYWPERALKPGTGFFVGTVFSLVGLAWARLVAPGILRPLPVEGLRAIGNGAGVALLLLVVDQMRVMEAHARAAASAEVRALQARMNPHFLFNALNTLAALAATAPAAIPPATARLARFLRASLEQQDRPLVPLREELETVSAYLDIEKLRFGDRLQVEQQVDPAVLDAPVPPFLIQPLVENAVRHGARAWRERGLGRGLVQLEVDSQEDTLVIRVMDNGPGIPVDQRRAILMGPTDGAHALALLRRRLLGLYGGRFRLTLSDRPGGGAMVTASLPREWDPARAGSRTEER